MRKEMFYYVPAWLLSLPCKVVPLQLA